MILWRTMKIVRKSKYTTRDSSILSNVIAEGFGKGRRLSKNFNYKSHCSFPYSHIIHEGFRGRARVFNLLDIFALRFLKNPIVTKTKHIWFSRYTSCSFAPFKSLTPISLIVLTVNRIGSIFNLCDDPWLAIPVREFFFR